MGYSWSYGKGHRAAGILEIEPVSPTGEPRHSNQSIDVLPVQGVLPTIRACAREDFADRKEIAAHLIATRAVVAVRPSAEQEVAAESNRVVLGILNLCTIQCLKRPKSLDFFELIW